MADARTAILITLDPAHEGGYQCDPRDHANWSSGTIGVGTLVGTNGGITAIDMPGADIKNLTTEQKISYYLEHFWKPFYSQIASQVVANKLFDMGVLFGIGRAVKRIQLALDVNSDGVFGPMTLDSINRANSTLLLVAFKSEMTALANGIAAANPAEAEDLGGWKNRINS